ncbi:MAG TPA: hypothetical protein VFB58_12655 [Chloroflexota bacterium]|nr:hypothetical protein [Chloroflexota bacterium]
MTIRILALALILTPALAVSAQGAASARPVTLMTIHMVTERSGWALSPHNLLHTSDGGQQWSVVTVPTNGVTLEGADLAVRGSDHLWVAAPLVTDHGLPRSAVLLSTDAGRHWATSSSLRGMPISMSWPNDRIGYILTGEGGAAGSVPNDVYATADGGHHWNLVEYNRMAQRSPGALTSCDGFAGISFAAPSVLLAAGGCGAGPRILMLYRSADGGRRWIQESLPVPRGEHAGYWNIAPPAFFGTQGVLPVSVGPPNAFVLYRSSNGGLSWVPTTPLHAPEPFVSPDAFALSPLITWAYVGNHLYLTTDGGASWRRAASLRFQTTPELDFVSLDTGFALGVGPGRTARNELYRTTDGTHWNRVRTVVTR